MAWTKVVKPTGTSYTPVNPQGREQYDQSTISYDDSKIYYDGINSQQYTKILKPTTPWTKVTKPS